MEISNNFQTLHRTPYHNEDIFYSGGYPFVMLEFTLAIIEGVVWGGPMLNEI